MTTKEITYILLILFSLTSCEDTKRSDELIIGEILPQLLDSLEINRTNLVPVPPVPQYESSIIVGVDTGATRENYQGYVEQLKLIESRDSRLLVGFVDSCLVVDFVYLKDRVYPDSALINRVVANRPKIIDTRTSWNLDLITCPSTHELMLASDLYDRYPDIWEIEDRKFCGLIAVSKVYLDDDNEVGILQFERYPFQREGASYFVIIERGETKWEVKRILFNWIS